MVDRNKQRVKLLYEDPRKEVQVGSQLEVIWIFKNISDSALPAGAIIVRKKGEIVDFKVDPLPEINSATAFKVTVKFTAHGKPGDYSAVF